MSSNNQPRPFKLRTTRPSGPAARPATRSNPAPVAAGTDANACYFRTLASSTTPQACGEVGEMFLTFAEGLDDSPNQDDLVGVVTDLGPKRRAHAEPEP